MAAFAVYANIVADATGILERHVPFLLLVS